MVRKDRVRKSLRKRLKRTLPTPDSPLARIYRDKVIRMYLCEKETAGMYYATQWLRRHAPRCPPPLHQWDAVTGGLAPPAPGKAEELHDAARSAGPPPAHATGQVCPTCSGNQITYTQAQTRSADEGMTTFFFCESCKARWRE